MKKYKVSIITPTYNHELYIAECIKSVLSQSYTNWEQIIIDDGSTDQTQKICEYYSNLDSRIKYIKQTNKGLYKLNETYNLALNNANGSLIAILEGDDYWYPEKLKRQVELFEDENLIFSWCAAQIVTNTRQVLGVNPNKFDPKKLNIYNNTPKGSFIEILLNEFPVPATWVIKRSELEKIGGFHQISEMPTVDLSTIILLTQKGKFGFINEPLVAYRRQINQATRTLAVEIGKGTKQIVSNFLESLSTESRKEIGISEKVIRKTLNNGITKAYSKQGRSNLVKKEFIEARKNFIKSITHSSDLLLTWRFKSLIGLICSFLKIDMEFLYKLIGKKPYQ